MAVAKYKVREEFEFDGVQKKIGEELFLRDSVGEHLVEDGKLILSRYLDPDNSEDAAKIAEVKAKPKPQAPVPEIPPQPDPVDPEGDEDEDDSEDDEKAGELPTDPDPAANETATQPKGKKTGG